MQTDSDQVQKKGEKKTARRIIRWLSIGNLIVVIAFLILLFGVSERWWLGVLATYSPRVFVLLPSLLLIPFSLFSDRRSAMLNSLAVVLVVLIGMEFNVPIGAKLLRPEEPANRTFRIVSCNVQRFAPDFPAVLAEILAVQRDLIVFQEALGPYPKSLVKALPDWHFVSHGEYRVASRYPARLAGRRQTKGFNRISVVAFEIDHPEGQIFLYTLHPKTPQFGIRHLFPGNEAPEDIETAIEMLNEYQIRRISVNREMRSFVEEIRQDRPIIIAGDFNVPVSSNLFKETWGDYTDAFSTAGWGYGYTAPCDGPGLMPFGWPWIRIDHILVDDSWDVVSAKIGKSNGSDHRMISADLRLIAPSNRNASTVSTEKEKRRPSDYRAVLK